MMENGEGLFEGVDLINRFIYYVGFVDVVGDEVVGLVGLIMVMCMDKFIDFMLEKIGFIGMIGKVECGFVIVDFIVKY